MNSYTLPAGRYYVGDPCYVFDEKWDYILRNTNFFDGYPRGELTEKIWGHSTKYGDGCYHGDNGRNYAVDAGLIGVVHESLMEHSPDDGGEIVTFDKPFDCRWEEENGTIIIGHIRIETDPEDKTCSWCGWDPCRCDDEEEESESW